ncbi:MAG: hypothetical protein QM673_11290 [Gordonia sp. (in: high G+C Gram-positive bacteria)]
MGRTTGRKPGYRPRVAGYPRPAARPAVAEDAVVTTAQDAAVVQDREITESPRPAATTRPVSRVSTLKPAVDAPDTDVPDTGIPAADAPAADVGTERTVSPNALPTPSAALRVRPRTVGVLAGVAAVLAAIAVVLAIHPGASIGSNKAFVDQAATAELISQAQTKICTANSASGVKFDEWAKKARAGLTGEALAQFNKQVAPLKQVMEQARATTDCQIDAIGVRDLSGDGDGARAVIVVNMVLSGTQNGVPTQSVTPRYQVQMDKHGDSWLIAQVEDI